MDALYTFQGEAECFLMPCIRAVLLPTESVIVILGLSTQSLSDFTDLWRHMIQRQFGLKRKKLHLNHVF